MEDLSLKKGQTFAEFNERFYKRFPDLTVFDCGEINLVKIVLDGLKVNYMDRGEVKTFLFDSVVIIRLRYFFRNLMKTPRSDFSKFKGRTILLDPGRTVSKNDNRLPYFDKVIDILGINHVFVISKAARKNERSPFSLTFEDIDVFAPHFLGFSEIALLKEIRTTLMLVKSKLSNSDFVNVCFAAQKFWEDSLAWNHFLNVIEPKKCILVPHYHREAMIYEVKKRNIEVIELQHGLISTKDIFYCFPKNIVPVRERALFADRILLFGDYWNEILSKGFEYQALTRSVVGDFVVRGGVDYELLIEKNAVVILVTSQTLMKDYIWDYTQRLASKIEAEKLNYKIWYKPHPKEYSDLSYCANNTYPEIVEVRTESLYALLEHADVQVSVYSTSLIEGLKFGVKAYSIYREDCADYIQDFVSEQISEIIEFDAIPNFGKKLKNGNQVGTRFFNDLDENLFEQIIE